MLRVHENRNWGDDEISVLPSAEAALSNLKEDHFSIENKDRMASALKKCAAAFDESVKPVPRVVPPSTNQDYMVDDYEEEMWAVHQEAVTHSATSRTELRSDSPIKLKLGSPKSSSPSMPIPQKSSPSPRTVSPLIVGSFDANPLPAEFLTPPVQAASSAKPAAIKRKTARPVTFRGPSSLESVHIIGKTPGTTPTSAELAAQEAPYLVPAFKLS